MKYFYAGPDNQPVGPYTVDELRKLAAEGKITAQTYVIPEGGQQWSFWGQVSANAGAPAPSVPGGVTVSGAAIRGDALNAGMAVLWFLLCFPIGFMMWNQSAKGWTWLIISCLSCGLGSIPAMVDYWMCYAVQEKRPLGPWEFFPSS
jgi:hypothetical protein